MHIKLSVWLGMESGQKDYWKLPAMNLFKVLRRLWLTLKCDDKHLQAVENLLNWESQMMSTKIEVNETEARLEQVKMEVEKTREKYLFLSKTSYATSRILAEGFLCKSEKSPTLYYATHL